MSAYHERLTGWLLYGTDRAATARRPRVEPETRRRPPVTAGRPVIPGRVRTTRLSSMESEMKHPGEILARHLRDLGLTASDLARDIDVPVNRVTGILNGQRGVTADTALRLGHWFGVDAADWLELQLQYELTQAQRENGAKIRKLPSLADRQQD